MSYTYAEPSGGVFAEPTHEVRYLLGDTLPVAPFSLSDGEIGYELALAGNVVRLAASNVAYKMSGRYSSQSITSKSVGDLSISRDYGAVASRYIGLSVTLRSGRDRGISPGMFFTGSGDEQFALGKHDNIE